jgi:hypothetical protein
MEIANHILAQEGILTTFSIAKKVTERDIKRLRDKLSKSSKVNAKKLEELLRLSILKETQRDIEQNNVPGLVIDGAEQVEEKKRLMELTYFASMMSKKLSEKNIDKYHACYIINAMVNLLGLTESDFNDFHAKFSKFKNGKNEDGSEDFNEQSPI